MPFLADVPRERALFFQGAFGAIAGLAAGVFLLTNNWKFRILPRSSRPACVLAM